MIKEFALFVMLTSSVGLLGAVNPNNQLDSSPDRANTSLRSTINMADVTPLRSENIDSAWDHYYDGTLGVNIEYFTPEFGNETFHSSSNSNFIYNSYFIGNSDDQSVYDDLSIAKQPFNVSVLSNGTLYRLYPLFQFNYNQDDTMASTFYLGMNYDDITNIKLMLFARSSNSPALYSAMAGFLFYVRVVPLELDLQDETIYYNLDPDYGLSYWCSFYDTGSNGVNGYSPSTKYLEGYSFYAIDLVLYNSQRGVSYNDSYSNGYTNGYNDGVVVGQETGNTLASLFFHIADIPLMMLHSMFNFDVFGISLFLGILGLFSVTIVIFVVKKVV